MVKSKWTDITNLVLGIWFFLTPWFFTNMPNNASTNAWLAGAAVSVAAGLALRDQKPWEEWVNLSLGIWIFLSPWVFGYISETNIALNSFIVGGAISVLAGYTVSSAQKVRLYRP